MIKSELKKSKRNIFFSFNDLNNFFTGLDIAIYLSLVPFLSYYFFPNLDSRLSQIYMTLIVSLSLTIRILGSDIINLLRNFEVKKKNFSLIILIVSTIPLFANSFFPNFFNLVIFILARLLMGIFLGLNDSLLYESNSKASSKNRNIKSFLIFSLGLSVALLFSTFINQIFSNSQLNSGSWKYSCLMFSTLSACFCLFININKHDNLRYQFKIEDEKMKINFPFVISYMLKNIFILLPYIFLSMFCLSFWLPGAVLSENTFISEVKLIHVIFFLISSIFSNFIFDLVGREKTFKYFIFFGLIISISMFILNFRESTYSLNFLHFFVAIYSSFAISIFLYENKIYNDENLKNLYFLINLPLFIISLLIPFFVYYLMFNVVYYNNIYLLIALLLVASLIGQKVLSRVK
tara:strand:+ start:211 stop:1428 length:1218 start_codon:yes stop_codon:yes gene_type:complete